MYAPTNEQIAEFKKKHSRIFLIEFPELDKACVLSKPSRQVVSLAFSKAAQDPLSMALVIRDNCWVAGDEELKTSDDMLTSLNTKIDKIVGITTTELKEL
jgi:hypothetical protein